MVGLGGSGTNDGGAGLLGALGATADRPLDAGSRRAGRRHRRSTSGPARARVAGVALDLCQRRRQPADRALRRDQDLRPPEGDRRGAAPGRRRASSRSSRRRPTVVPRWRRAPAPPAASASPCCCSVPPGGRASTSSPTPSTSPARARAADLVVTGEGAFDFSSRSGKVPYGVATVAAEALRPCVALAGQVLVGSREMRALGHRVGVLPGRAGRGGARPGRPGRAAWPSSPHGWPAPGRADRAGSGRLDADREE